MLIDGSYQYIPSRTAFWKALVHTDFIMANPLEDVREKTASQGAIGPTSWVVYGTEKDFTIWSIGEHITQHCIAVVATIDDLFAHLCIQMRKTHHP